MLIYLASLAESRIFGVIFWFFLLGPTGAVIYYLTLQLCKFSEHEEKGAPYGELKQCADKFSKILDWLPQRLAALAFMLVGNFYKSWGHFRQMLFVGLDKSSECYQHTALQALDYERLIAQPDKKPIRRGIELIERALILWLVIMAIMTLL
jgi:membrane protein required for beta-lactamase induction